jgi:hypothetical protein
MESFAKAVFTVIGGLHLLLFGGILLIGLLWFGVVATPICCTFIGIFASVRFFLQKVRGKRGQDTESHEGS